MAGVAADAEPRLALADVWSLAGDAGQTGPSQTEAAEAAQPAAFRALVLRNLA